MHTPSACSVQLAENTPQEHMHHSLIFVAAHRAWFQELLEWEW